MNVTKKEDMKRRVVAPGRAGPSGAGEMLSVELGADEDVQWTWCHHGESGSSVIGYTILAHEPLDTRQPRPIGFFPLEEKNK